MRVLGPTTMLAAVATLAVTVGVAGAAGPPAPWFREPPPPQFTPPRGPVFTLPRSPSGFPTRAPAPWPSPPGTQARYAAPTLLHPGDPAAYDTSIREAAGRYRIEVALVKAIIRTESAFDRLAVSPAGARGLMQLMPGTAAQHGVRNAFAADDNLAGGCQHLRLLLDRYRGDLRLALAAYNAGVQRVAEAHGVPAIPETREYVERVLRYRAAYAAAERPRRRL